MHVADVNRSWLAEALEVPTDDLVDLELAPVGTGQVADTYRATFGPGDLRRSLVLKLTSDNEDSRHIGQIAANYLREVNFYRDLAPSLAVSVPHCRYAEIDENGVEFAIVMEDLSPASQGDQLQGCSEDDAVSVLVQASKLHAGTWRRTDLLSMAWLAAGTPQQLDPSFSYVPIFEGYMERYADLVVDEFEHVGGTFARNIGQYYALLMQADPKAVIHADFRLDNVMFGGAPNPQNVTIVDWQTVQFGPPMMDVAYFVGTSFTAEDRRDVEVRLVEGYHASLLGAGVHDYSLAACWDDYARFSFQAVAVGMGAAMAVKRTDRGDQIFTSMVNRAVQQIVDHDALRFIK